jgi:anti-sigma factor RsiW
MRVRTFRARMGCSEFLDRYSDFTDGLLDEGGEVEMHLHLAACARCRRFDGAYHAGRGALRHLPPVSPSSGFRARLEARLAAERAVPEPSLGQWSGAAGALLVVAVVGVAAWDEAEGPSAATRRTEWRASGPVVPVDPPGPFEVRFAGDTILDYPTHFPVIPVPRGPARAPASAPTSFELAVDWVVP